MKLEKTACLFCGSEKCTPFRSVTDIVTCASCGSIYLRTRPDQETIRTLFHHTDDSSYLRPPDTVRVARQSGLRRQGLVEEIISQNAAYNKGVWLDVGCGWGAMLDEVRDRGYFPKGIELAKDCLDFAAMQLNLPVSDTDLLGSKIESNSCSVISMMHTLQYLPYPKQAVSRAYDLLGDHGLFCGIVPNINSICSQHLKDKWPWLDAYRQFAYYSVESLVHLLQNAGFSVEKIYTTTGDYDQSGVLECIRQTVTGIDTPEKAKSLLPELMAANKGEEIHFFARKSAPSMAREAAPGVAYSGQTCPCCGSLETQQIRKVEGYDYFQCLACESLFLDTKFLAQIDSGLSLVKYEEGYWKMELDSAKQRSYGAALARMAEAIYYCKRPIKKFLDIGTGPGYFLDAIAKYLPDNHDIFYGVELFPPEIQYRTNSKNYIIGDLGDLKDKFDCGICIEVIEHLTPKTLTGLLKKLAEASNPGALYIFNTGMPDYVLHEDINYLDPVRRGHLVSYSLKAMSFIAGRFGFTARPITGKTWAFVLELTGTAHAPAEDIRDRIWNASAENLNILTDQNMGDILKILGRESSRAYN